MDDRTIFAGSLWSALTPQQATGTRLDGSEETDVAIVGGGFLGLSTALHLAEAGVRVTVLEAEAIGFGASGRNTGFVVPSLKTALGPADVAQHLGKTHADNYVRLIGGSGDAVFGLIKRLGIDCAAEQKGWFQPAHSAAMARRLEQRANDWRGSGADVELVSGDEVARRTGLPGYHGAIFVPSGGQINPLAYVRGLARAAVAAGAVIHEGARVSRVEPDRKGWRVRTPAGDVLATRVLLATNAMVGPLRPEIEYSMVPARVHQIATGILPGSARRIILPERTPVADTRRHTFAVRWSPDGRLITGGLVLPGPGSVERARRFFNRRLGFFFPQVGSIKVDYVWSGVVAMTLNSLPRFVSLGPGLDAAFGCNGRGIALTTSLGRDIAALYAGRMTEAEFPLPVTAPKAVPGRQLSRIGPPLYLPWSEFRDWADSRQAP